MPPGRACAKQPCPDRSVPRLVCLGADRSAADAPRAGPHPEAWITHIKPLEGTHGAPGRWGPACVAGGYLPVSLTWPRISPAPFFTVWTLTYAVPCSSAFSILLEIFARPLDVALQGPQSGTTT